MLIFIHYFFDLHASFSCFNGTHLHVGPRYLYFQTWYFIKSEITILMANQYRQSIKVVILNLRNSLSYCNQLVFSDQHTSIKIP